MAQERQDLLTVFFQLGFAKSFDFHKLAEALRPSLHHGSKLLVDADDIGWHPIALATFGTPITQRIEQRQFLRHHEITPWPLAYEGNTSPAGQIRHFMLDEKAVPDSERFLVLEEGTERAVVETAQNRIET